MHAHRLADGLRHHRRGLRGILVATAAERAGALDVPDADLFNWQAGTSASIPRTVDVLS
jgi:hypothetical protein